MEIENEILKRRTFGIISHPDAGKTTLTEKQIAQLQQHMILDKKSINKKARFVLLNGIGQARVKEDQYSFAVDPVIIDQALSLWKQEQ